MTINLHLLVFSRSQYCDYQWLCGLEDEQLEEDVRELCVQNVGISVLRKNPLSITLHTSKQHFALMIAGISQTRNDSFHRPILEYSILLWDAGHSLKYQHLAALLIILKSRIKDIYDNIPEYVYRIVKRTYSFEVTHRELDDLAHEEMRNLPLWKLPGNLTWKRVAKEKLTVEVPNNFDFFTMLSGLADQPLVKSAPILLGKGLSYSDRFSSDYGWLISPSDPRPNKIRVLDINGIVISLQNLGWINVPPVSLAHSTLGSTQQIFRTLEKQDFRSKAVDFYTCFISFTEADDAFSERLYNDLQAKGVRCWRWKEDARWGKTLMRSIDEAVQVYDKLIVICSEQSLNSPAVIREIERALQKEDDSAREGKEGEVLFPIRLDDYIFTGWTHHRKADVTAKNVGDFRQWEQHAAYKKAFDRLLRDLKAEEKKV